MPLTVLICAIWLVTWALSIGLSGSWFCIWATSSFRKRSDVAVASLVLAAAGVELPLKSLGGRKSGAADGHGGLPVCAQPWPSCSVFSSRLLAVFITSMLFWYEREAEIMLTISSTALTLL